MIKIATIVQQQIEASPFLTDALKDRLINVSALARKIKPEVEQKLGKDVQESAITMAINRLQLGGELTFVEKGIRQFFSKLNDISVRSNLVDYTFQNSSQLSQNLTTLLEVLQTKYPNTFYSFSQGVGETTIIVTDAIQQDMEAIFKSETLIAKEVQLSAITLVLPKENRQLYGIYYYILKELAWKGINLVELISTSNEFTIIVRNSNLNEAFTVLSDLRNF